MTMRTLPGFSTMSIRPSGVHAKAVGWLSPVATAVSENPPTEYVAPAAIAGARTAARTERKESRQTAALFTPRPLPGRWRIGNDGTGRATIPQPALVFNYIGPTAALPRPLAPGLSPRLRAAPRSL